MSPISSNYRPASGLTQIINTPPATLIDQPTMLMRRGVTRGPLSQRKGDFMGAIMGRN